MVGFFVKKYRNWSEEDWSKVMFSDERTFHCLRATRSWVSQPTGSGYFDSRYTIQTAKHTDSVMVWGVLLAMEDVEAYTSSQEIKR